MNAQIPSSIGKSLFETSPESAAANWKAVEGYKEYRRAIAGITLTNRLTDNWSNRLTLFGNRTDSYERRPFNNLRMAHAAVAFATELSYHRERFDALMGVEDRRQLPLAARIWRGSRSTATGSDAATSTSSR